MALPETRILRGYPGPLTVTFDYDALGNRTEMVDSTGTTTYEYDALNRLTSVTFPGSRSVGYAYDALGRRTSITYPGGSDEVTYAYDEAGNLVSVTDWNDDETTKPNQRRQRGDWATI